MENKELKEFKEILHEVKDTETAQENNVFPALFLPRVGFGAGFSKNAEKIAMTDKKFLDWNKLSDKFYEAVYGENKKPGKEYNSSLRLAQEVEISLGRPKLEKIIKNAVPDMEYAPSQLYIRMLELPWKDIFTTNYDTLLERAAEKVTKRRYNVVVSQNDLINSADATRIVKLHGSFPIVHL